LINQLRYKDHQFGHFQVLLQELNTDLANPDMQDIQSKDFMFEYIKNGLITKNKLMMRKFCMINDLVCRQASKKNPNLRIIIPQSKLNEIFKQFYKDVTDGHFEVEKTV